MFITTCSATLTWLLPVISTTSMLCSTAASKSTWSEPTPAVIASFKLGAFLTRSFVIYAGKNGELIITSMSLKCSSRSEEHTSELQSRGHLVCRRLLQQKKHTEPS